MARSTYIYVLLSADDEVIGTFTVKHECVSTIRQRLADPLRYQPTSVQTWTDGRSSRLVSTAGVANFLPSP